MGILVLPLLAAALLVFCEGRRNGRGDSGDIDLLVDRKTGAVWAAPVEITRDVKRPE